MEISVTHKFVPYHFHSSIVGHNMLEKSTTMCKVHYTNVQ